MKLSSTPLAKISVRYGFLAGAIGGVLLIILFYIGRHPMLIQPYLDFRILLFGLFMYFGIKEVRDQHQNGYIYFWQAIVGSYIVVFLGSLVAGFILYLFCQIDPDFVSTYIPQREAIWESYSSEEIETLGGKEVYDRNIQDLRATNAMTLATTYITQGIILGLFVSIIVSVILRRTPKQ